MTIFRSIVVLVPMHTSNFETVYMKLDNNLQPTVTIILHINSWLVKHYSQHEI